MGAWHRKGTGPQGARVAGTPHCPIILHVTCAVTCYHMCRPQLHQLTCAVPCFAVPCCAVQGVAELKRDMSERAVLVEMPEIHQFLDGFYLSRIGIRILIGE